MTHLAVFHIVFHPYNGLGKAIHLIGRLTEQMKNKAQGGLPSHARQLGEGLNGTFQELGRILLHCDYSSLYTHVVPLTSLSCQSSKR